MKCDLYNFSYFIIVIIIVVIIIIAIILSLSLFDKFWISNLTILLDISEYFGFVIWNIFRETYSVSDGIVSLARSVKCPTTLWHKNIPSLMLDGESQWRSLERCRMLWHMENKNKASLWEILKLCLTECLVCGLFYHYISFEFWFKIIYVSFPILFMTFTKFWFLGFKFEFGVWFWI